MNLEKRPFAVVALALAAVALTACSTGGTAGSPRPSSSSSSSESGSVTAPEGATPLTAYLNSLYGLADGPEAQAEQTAARRVQQEELVSTCMKAEGFDYTPEAVDVASFNPEVGPTQEDLDSRDWVAQYGYGMIETPEGRTSELYTDTERKGGTNANSAYIDSLTASERTAYDAAYTGSPSEQTDDMNLVDDWEAMGCLGAARHATGERGDPLDSSAGAAVQAKIDDFYSGYADWNGLPELDAAWAACMTEGGYPGFSRQGDASIEMSGKLAEAVGAAAEDALLVEERTIALADLDCREETDFRDTVRNISFAAETQFMDDNRAEFDEFAASVAQADAR
jgi:hypothetical protein